MLFSKFAEFLQTIESTGGRNEMTRMLAEFLPELKGEEIKQVMYLMQGRLVPGYVDLEFNFSQKLAIRAFTEMLEAEKSKLDAAQLMGKLGDLGLVAETLIKELKLKRSGLSISAVYQKLEDIAKAEGKGSQEAKMKGFTLLVMQLEPLAARYACRVIIGSLRLGLSEKTVFDALSVLKAGDKSLREALERAFGARADIGELAQIVLQSSNQELNESLAQISLKPGVPVSSKLVERELDAEAIWKRMGECVVQPKLDGLRAQIHFTPQGEGLVFSRNMESLSESFPDLVAAVKKLGVKSAIIDSEAIGYDIENDTYLPFQDTMQRRRKYDIEAMAESIPVRAMAFDLLYLNGEDLSRHPLQERLAKLQQILDKAKSPVIKQLETVTVKDVDQLSKYFHEQVGKGLEGIIIKKLDTPYEPGTRNFDWIKWKANTQSHLVDTLDTVVLGYYHGQGVRSKFGIGAVLVGVYDSKTDKYYSVAKVGTGMKDDDWRLMKSDLQPLETPHQPPQVLVEKMLYPDVWVQPQIVMEIDADEITRSPGHTAARELKAKFELELTGKGLSLRFPRMKVWNRDKKPTQATSVSELLRMYELRRGAS